MVLALETAPIPKTNPNQQEGNYNFVNFKLGFSANTICVRIPVAQEIWLFLVNWAST
jgi:hypothetical protein